MSVEAYTKENRKALPSHSGLVLNDPDYLQYMRANRWEVDFRDPANHLFTPPMLAVILGRLKQLPGLLALNPNLSLQDREGFTVLDHANRMGNGSLEIITKNVAREKLPPLSPPLKEKHRMTALMVCVANGKAKEAIELVRKQHQLFEKDRYGLTFLHHAVLAEMLDSLLPHIPPADLAKLREMQDQFNGTYEHMVLLTTLPDPKLQNQREQEYSDRVGLPYANWYYASREELIAMHQQGLPRGAVQVRGKSVTAFQARKQIPYVLKKVEGIWRVFAECDLPKESFLPWTGAIFFKPKDREYYKYGANEIHVVRDGPPNMIIVFGQKIQGMREFPGMLTIRPIKAGEELLISFPEDDQSKQIGYQRYPSDYEVVKKFCAANSLSQIAEALEKKAPVEPETSELFFYILNTYTVVLQLILKRDLSVNDVEKLLKLKLPFIWDLHNRKPPMFLDLYPNIFILEKKIRKNPEIIEKMLDLSSRRSPKALNHIIEMIISLKSVPLLEDMTYFGIYGSVVDELSAYVGYATPGVKLNRDFLSQCYVKLTPPLKLMLLKTLGEHIDFAKKMGADLKCEELRSLAKNFALVAEVSRIAPHRVWETKDSPLDQSPQHHEARQT